jgi:hypothetical protein
LGAPVESVKLVTASDPHGMQVGMVHLSPLIGTIIPEGSGLIGFSGQEMVWTDRRKQLWSAAGS